MRSIVHLDFDSNLFGYNVGKVTIQNPSQLEELSHTGYRLIYAIPSNQEVEEILKSKGRIYEKLSLVNNEPFYYDINSNIESHLKKDLNENLFNLTLQSGAYSRFAVDENFTSNEFLKLYEMWIEKSLSESIAKEVFVYKFDGKIVGFITLSINEEASNIGLIAVDEKIRGKGIGKALLESAHNFTKNNNLKSITVNTQGDNVIALNFYRKFGFETYHSEKYYHHWNL